MSVLDTPASINMLRLATLKAGLKLELFGMRISRGPSCYSRIKKEFGFKGNKQAVLTQMESLIEKIKQAVADGNAVVV